MSLNAGIHGSGARTNNRLRRWQLLVFFMLTILTLLVGHPAKVYAAIEPEVTVREVFDQLLGRLAERPNNGPLSKDEVYEIFNTLLRPHIDFDTLARWILRDHWVHASSEQHQAFITAFQDYIINTYALALSVDQTIVLDVKDNPQINKNLAVVAADLSIADSGAVPLKFRLLQRDDLWKLFDVSFSGVSLAKTFRSDFSYVAQNGGIDAVTAFLVQRQAENRQASEP